MTTVIFRFSLLTKLQKDTQIQIYYLKSLYRLLIHWNKNPTSCIIQTQKVWSTLSTTKSTFQARHFCLIATIVQGISFLLNLKYPKVKAKCCPLLKSDESVKTCTNNYLSLDILKSRVRFLSIQLSLNYPSTYLIFPKWETIFWGITEV